MSRTELLYSESASRLLVSVKPDLAMLLDALGLWQICRRIGTVTGDGNLTLKSGDSTVLRENVEDLARAFKRTLTDNFLPHFSFIVDAAPALFMLGRHFFGSRSGRHSGLISF